MRMTRRHFIAAGSALAVVLLALGAWLLHRRVPLDEAVELAAQGGARQLRKSIRPDRGAPRVLMFAFDGVGVHELEAVLAGKPGLRMQRLIGPRKEGGVFRHAYSAPDVLGILPTTTIAAWSSIYTGQPPARTGVPGNEWFARDERRFYAPVPVSVKGRADTLHMLTDGLVGNALRTPTLFELADVRSHVSLAAVYRGADVFTSPEPLAIADLFAEAAEGWVESKIELEAYSEVDQESVASLLSAIERHGVPVLQVVYFAGIDLFTHMAERPLEQQKRYLRDVIDPLIGQVLNAYEKQGALKDTYVVLVSDHGHTPVLRDDRHALSVDGDDEPPALIEQLGYRLRPFEVESDADDFQAVVAYQGAMAYIYLADRSTCAGESSRCDWQRAPRFDADVLPLLRAFHRVNQTGEPIPALEGTLDLVFSREPRPVGQDARPFQVFDGERLVPISEYLRANPRDDLLRLEERMDGLAAGPHGHRAGDILLLAKSGLERPIEDRYYFSHEYSSWHGSPTGQDSRIPLIVARQNGDGQAIAARVRAALGPAPSQLGVVPLVRALLEKSGE